MVRLAGGGDVLEPLTPRPPPTSGPRRLTNGAGSGFDEARAAYSAAIEASPQSPFLHRELADVEKRAGQLDSALDHARKASELEPDEPRTHILLGEIYEARGDFARAADEFASAVALQPDDAITARIETPRSRAAFAAMPAEYRSIGDSDSLTRGQLAALLAVKLEKGGAPDRES